MVGSIVRGFPTVHWWWWTGGSWGWLFRCFSRWRVGHAPQLKATPPPPTTSPSFLQHLDLQVSSYLSCWSLSRLNERRSQLAESKWDSFNSESFKSLSVVVTQKTPKTHWTKETTTGALVWVPCLREWWCMYLWKWCRCVQENICEVEKSTVVVTVNGWYLQYSTWTVAF